MIMKMIVTSIYIKYRLRKILNGIFQFLLLEILLALFHRQVVVEQSLFLLIRYHFCKFQVESVKARGNHNVFPFLTNRKCT